MPDDLLSSIAHPRPGRGRRLRPAVAGLAVVALASLGACSQDTASDGVEPSDQEPLPAQQPEGGDDPTLSGDESTPGVGDGQTGGSGSGSPDSGDLQGEVGDSPTAGEQG